MKITIKGEQHDLHYSMRIYLYYENIMGKSLDYNTVQSYNSLIVLFYSAILATLQYNKSSLQIGFDDFMDFVDTNGGPTILNDFAVWFTNELQIQTTVSKEVDDDKIEQAKKTKKKS